MTEVTAAVSGCPIRLTDERWSHICEEHNELAGLKYEVLVTVAHPDSVRAGNHGERLAVREIANGKQLIAVYRENNDDGFIITAFVTKRVRSIEKRRQIWP